MEKMPEVVIGRDDDDLRKYGAEGAVLIGRHLVGTGEDAHLTTPVLLDVLRPHVITICGKRGTGKSFSMGVIAEEFFSLPDKIRRNLCALMIDTQGIFWTMKSPNEKELILLKELGLEPKGFDIVTYVPEGQAKRFSSAGVDYDDTFSIAANELSAEDWISVFDLNPNEPMGILVQMGVAKLGDNYSLDDIISEIKRQAGFEKEKLALINMFETAKTWGMFGKSRMPRVLEPGKVSVLDLSITPQNVRALLLSIACKKILDERIEARRKEELSEIEVAAAKRTPMPWILIDEAHNFIPNDSKTPSTDVLGRIIKEGRQPGITLVFATQRPEKLHPDALAQCDLIISHRLTAKADIDALNAIMQTYMLAGISKYLNELPNMKGTAIILDDNSERIYKVRIRPRMSWHAGASPVAV